MSPILIEQARRRAQWFIDHIYIETLDIATPEGQALAKARRMADDVMKMLEVIEK